MSGHSKWATIKHKKAILDSRRSKNFAKLIKAIEVSSRVGGADMSGNPTLFDAVTRQKRIQSLPTTSIELLSEVLALKLVEKFGKQLCMKVMQQEE